MNKILITGASGFLGKELLRKLKFKKVYSFSRKRIKTYCNHKNVICDLRNKKKLINKIKAIRPTLIYHLAWFKIPYFDKKNFKENLKITKNLVEAANIIKCKKIIVSGTCAEYSFSNKRLSENMKSKQLTELGNQKKKIMNYFLKNLNSETVLIWLRIFYVFGKDQRKGSLIDILKKKTKNFFMKTPFVKNDFIFIKDVVNALEKVVILKKSSIINVCSGKSISNLNFAKKFLRISKKEMIIDYNNNDKNKKSLFGNNKKLRKLGWKQKYTLEKAIREIVS